MLGALLLGATVIGGISAVTIASKNVEDTPKTVNHINNNTVINNNQKFIHNNQKITNNTTNVKNSMNQTKEESDNKALEEKITQELNRIEEEIIEEMLQQFYINNLENDISGKIKGGK